MTRHSYQRGYVSEGKRTRRGLAFVIRYRLRTTEGKWTHKSEVLYGLAGKKEARAELDKRIRSSENRPLEQKDLTVQDFVETYWRPYLDRKQVKPSTRRSYESGLRLHILPAMGALRLLDASALHIENLLRGRLESGASPKTVRNVLALLQSIFSLALDIDLIARSPVRKSHKPAVNRCEKPTWTPEQMRSIIESVSLVFRPLFQCAMLTGARLGELLGLQWKYVDLAERRLEIRQALWEGQLVAPKTHDSTRSIYFGPALSSAFEAQRLSSRHTTPESFVFCKADGSPLNPDVLRRDVLYPALDRLGIPRSSRTAGFHTFRHSAASLINARTGNLKLAQKLLGHSNLSTTADVYTHTSAEADASAALALEQAIYGDLFAIVPKSENTNSSAAIN